MTTPVLLLLFNRPDLAQLLIGRVLDAGSRDVYVVVDGARPGTSDNQRCSKVRHIVENAYWPGKLHTRFRSENLGCKRSVSDGISWFLEEVGEGVILEEDCMPSQSFFGFSERMLAQYHSDTSIGLIAGTHYRPTRLQSREKLFFSRYGMIWGWATWLRAWRSFDGEMTDWPEIRKTDWLMNVVGGHRDAEYFWRTAFDRCAFGSLDSWAIPWMYSLWRSNMKSLHVNRNLVINVGFSAEATHTKAPVPSYREVSLQELNLEVLDPPRPEIDKAEDRWLEIHYFQTRRAWNPARRFLLLPLRSVAKKVLPDRLRSALSERGLILGR